MCNTYFFIGAIEQLTKKSLIRYCPKCDVTTDQEVNCNKDFCRKCKAWLSYQCLKCSKRYENFQSSKYHVVNVCYPQKIYKCTVCNYSTPNEYSLARHMSIHLFKCSICNENFNTAAELYIHREQCTMEKTLACEYCPFETTYQRIFRNHVRRHAITIQEKKGIYKKNTWISLLNIEL